MLLSDYAGLVQIARSQGNNFSDVRSWWPALKCFQDKAFRPSGHGLYAAKCYPSLNQAIMRKDRSAISPGRVEPCELALRRYDQALRVDLFSRIVWLALAG